jgi:hypothetical protein
MKSEFLILKIIIAPVRIPIEVLWKFRGVLALTFLAGSLNGCASKAPNMPKSPCACDFRPINDVERGRISNA